MSIDKKILEELSRYNSINNYISEQDVPAIPPTTPEPGTTGMETTTPTEPVTTEPEVIDVEMDTEVEKIDDKGASEETEETEELDITDLVSAQEKIQTKQDEYFDNLFKQLENLSSKLSEMDTIVDKVNSIEQKIEKYRIKTPEEKLELRSLDSYPYSQKLTDFFVDKEQEIEKSGKNEYILTSDEVSDFSPSEVRKTFQPPKSLEDGLDLNKY